MISAEKQFEAWLIDPTSSPQWLKDEVQSDPVGSIDSIVRVAYLAGYAAGAKDMRERAADIAFEDYQAHHSTSGSIRSLPIETKQ